MGTRLSTGSPSSAHVRSGSTTQTTTTSSSSTHNRAHHHGGTNHSTAAVVSSGHNTSSAAAVGGRANAHSPSAAFRLFSRSRTTSSGTSSVIDPSSFNSSVLRYVVGLDAHPQDSDASSDEESPRATRRLHHFLFALRGKLNDIQCPVCSKTIPSDTFDVHILQCLSKPRIDYNEDVLTEDKGECVICLEELETGQKIARLPCLCIYHKHCIDEWFRRNRCCPEHPGD